jgi:hypothetical protein
MAPYGHLVEASDGLSLYFKLKDGEKADLEVISSAALAWVETIRAAVKEIDPSADVRVELVDAEEGSLRFNTLIDWLGKKLEETDQRPSRRWRVYRLFLAFIIFVPTVGIPTWDFYFGDDKTELSEEDRALLKELVERAAVSHSVEAPRRRFYRTLERDRTIEGVGIAEGRDDPPAVMILSDRFAEMSGLWAPEEDIETTRTTRPVLEVILIRPALVHTPRSWTFKPDGLPEFDAVMRDPRVLNAIRSRGIQERMREGIPMTIRLEIRERRLADGTWHLVRGGRSVIEVISPSPD